MRAAVAMDPRVVGITAAILHRAGDISREFLGTQHWWRNEATTVVTLTIADIVNDKKPDSMMPMM